MQTSVVTKATLATAIANSTASLPTTTPKQAVKPIDLVAQPFDLVAQQFDELMTWRKNCGYKPKLCHVEQFTIVGTEFSESFAQMMRGFAKNNIYTKPGDGERKITVQTIDRDEATMTATINGCVYDTVVVYMSGFIYNGNISSALSSWTMQWRNDKWYWTDYRILKKIYNANICES